MIRGRGDFHAEAQREGRRRGVEGDFFGQDCRMGRIYRMGERVGLENG
jgi:hypothetical protein